METRNKKLGEALVGALIFLLISPLIVLYWLGTFIAYVTWKCHAVWVNSSVIK